MASKKPLFTKTPFASFKTFLSAPASAYTLAAFRIVFGFCLAFEMIRYYPRLHWLYIDPTFHFYYEGFSFIQPWNETGIYIHVGVIFVSALLVAVGALYRIASITFFLSFTHFALWDQTKYLNHFYLICLLGFLLCFVDAHRAWSIDALWRKHIARDFVPRWQVWIFRAQLFIVYFYGGLAKLNDDWLAGEPIRKWLAKRSEMVVVGPYLELEPTVWAFAYGGIAFDLLIGWMLFHRSLRWVALPAILAFHFINATIFNIGIFPWLMIGATIIFFDIPKKMELPPLKKIKLSISHVQPRTWPRSIALWLFARPATNPLGYRSLHIGSATPYWVLLYLFLQAAVPLRHFFIPGNVSWTEEGHKFAWHMKLRSKRAHARFFVTNPITRNHIEISPSQFLFPKQERKMSTRPNLILQFSHFLAARYERFWGVRPTVQALVYASLNGREYQMIINPYMDLGAEQYDFFVPAKWIVPLDPDNTLGKYPKFTGK